jgi:hypothetical protein
MNSKQDDRAALIFGTIITIIFLYMLVQFFTTPGACLPMSRPGGGDNVTICNDQ